MAQQVTPLTELSAFQQPQIEASGCTALGEALTLLAQKVDTEIVKTTQEVKGDWKPLVFLMTVCKVLSKSLSLVGSPMALNFHSPLRL